MTNTVTEEKDKLIVRLQGEVDLEHATGVRKLLLDSLGKMRDVIVDLSAVDYIDSSGIANLVEALQTAKGQGTGFRLAAVSPQAMRVLELARLDKVFSIDPDLDSAVDAAV